MLTYLFQNRLSYLPSCICVIAREVADDFLQIVLGGRHDLLLVSIHDDLDYGVALGFLVLHGGIDLDSLQEAE